MGNLSSGYSKKIIVVGAVGVFFAIMAATFYLTYKFATRATLESRQQQVANEVIPVEKNQQVRRVTFQDVMSGETVELFSDGVINYYDKNGKLIKTGRRGFAETQSVLRDLEKLINSGGKVGGYKGYRITIDTEQGTIVVEPGSQGEGGSVIDDLFDYIDETLNPTPRPSPQATPTPSPTPSSEPSPTPDPVNPSPNPSPSPFNCADYYKSGRPMKINDTVCGPSDQ